MRRQLYEQKNNTNFIVTELKKRKNAPVLYVRIKDGETYYELAKKYYKNENLWPLIIKTNYNLSPFEKPPVGQEIMIIRSQPLLAKLLEEM